MNTTETDGLFVVEFRRPMALEWSLMPYIPRPRDVAEAIADYWRHVAEADGDATEYRATPAQDVPAERIANVCVY